MTSINNFSKYGYMYSHYEKLQSLDMIKILRLKLRTNLAKKSISVKSNSGGEYYGGYDGSSENIQDCLLSSKRNVVSSCNTLCWVRPL